MNAATLSHTNGRDDSVEAGAEHPTFESINRLAREYERKEYFDGAWALRPVELVSFGVKILNP